MQKRENKDTQINDKEAQIKEKDAQTSKLFNKMQK
jgi:hypothetical protein